jgi:hypothetical protein
MDQAEQQTGQMPEQKDVSRQTMVVLVILAIVVSLLGTFTVLRETTGANKIVYRSEVSEQPSQSAQGMISLTIVDSNGQVADSATGRVTFNIIEP